MEAGKMRAGMGLLVFFLFCSMDMSEGSSHQLSKACNSIEDTYGASFLELVTSITERANTTSKTVAAACPKECSGNGICNAGNCMCQPGFGGSDCSVDMCEHFARCSGHGRCLRAECFCDAGFTGEKCDELVECPSKCSEHGVCKNGRCYCDPGYEGDKCAVQSVCKNGCSKHGVCMKGNCTCSPGWGEDDCSLFKSLKPCKFNCGGPTRGECREGQCFCLPGFEGELCEKQKKCSGDCNGHGSCQFGTRCLCDPGWGGLWCDVKARCPKDCYNHGTCQNGKCYCHPGYGGPLCKEEAVCLNDCSGVGLCLAGKCHCESGFSGEDCSLSLKAKPSEVHGCPSDCSGHGICAAGMNIAVGDPLGECLCDVGYKGVDCSQAIQCPGANLTQAGGLCSGHGACSFGKCVCMTGFDGPGCELTTSGIVLGGCSKPCEKGGTCSQGKCYCEPGFSGPTCATAKACKDDCNGKGVCSRGKCFCQPGFGGDLCQAPDSCGSDCSNHGVCVDGKCLCEMGYSGKECSLSPSCESPCMHGLCRNGKCFCEDGFTGRSCNIAVASVATQVGGGQCLQPCVNGKCELVRTRLVDGTDQDYHMAFACKCRSGFIGADCSKPALSLSYRCTAATCKNGECSGAGVCMCRKGFKGESCSDVDTGNVNALAGTALCDSSSCTHGSCNQEGICVCAKGYFGTKCEQTTKSSSEAAAKAFPPGTIAAAPKNTSCVKMSAQDVVLWQSMKTDRAIALNSKLQHSQNDEAAKVARIMGSQSVFLEEAARIKRVRTCALECTPSIGRCIAGDCVCQPNVASPFCLAGAVLTTGVSEESSVQGFRAVMGGKAVVSLNSAWTGSTLLACAVFAFAFGLGAGLFIMMFSDFRKRALAQSILAKN